MHPSSRTPQNPSFPPFSRQRAREARSPQLWLTALTLLLGVAVAPPSQAQAAPETPRTLTVVGVGQATAAPDLAVVTLAVETEAEEAAQAVTENARRTEQVLASVRALLGEEDRLTTTGYSLYPRYHQPRPDYTATPRIVGYTARNQVRVELRDLANIGRVIDSATAAGANRVDQLQFQLQDRAATLGSALAFAAAEARAQAVSVAGALGVTLGPVLEASTTPSPGIGPQMRFERAEAMAMPAPTPIEPGEVTMTTTLRVTYSIE